MRDDLQMVWLVARRELRDQFRDWRIMTPLIILTLAFPLLMNEVARNAVAFINQYGANLIVDRLVPFSILIIGFFPITISLVVALESFVGEKERGTIEPLLSSPLENRHLYFGKLLVGNLYAAGCGLYIHYLLCDHCFPPASSYARRICLYAVIYADNRPRDSDGQRGHCDFSAVDNCAGRQFAGFVHRGAGCDFDAGRERVVILGQRSGFVAGRCRGDHHGVPADPRGHRAFSARIFAWARIRYPKSALDVENFLG